MAAGSRHFSSKRSDPNGASVSQGRGGAGGSEASFSARIVTSLTLAELTTHYVQQLESQGWKTSSLQPLQRLPPVQSTTTAETVTLLTPPMATNERIAGMLGVTQIAYSSTFDISLSIYRCGEGRGGGGPCAPTGPRGSFSRKP